MHVVTEAGEVTPTRGWCGRRWKKGGIPTQRKESLDLTSMDIREYSASMNLVVCLSSTFALWTQMQNLIMGNSHTKSCLSTSGTKRGNILKLALRDNITSCRLYYMYMGWWWRILLRQLSNLMIPCQTNRASNTSQHVGMSGHVSTWTCCGPSAWLYGGHGVAIPGEKYICQRTEWGHQEWICRKFREMNTDQRRFIFKWWS